VEIEARPRQGQDGIAHGIADHRTRRATSRLRAATDLDHRRADLPREPTHAGMRPANQRGHSVSARRRRCADEHHQELGGGVRLALAQYRELAAFSQFASDLDEATPAQLERGVRVTELMKQKQYAPMSVAEMALTLYAGTKRLFRQGRPAQGRETEPRCSRLRAAPTAISSKASRRSRI